MWKQLVYVNMVARKTVVMEEVHFVFVFGVVVEARRFYARSISLFEMATSMEEQQVSIQQ